MKGDLLHRGHQQDCSLFFSLSRDDPFKHIEVSMERGEYPDFARVESPKPGEEGAVPGEAVNEDPNLIRRALAQVNEGACRAGDDLGCGGTFA